jgi:hypothetical protein
VSLKTCAIVPIDRAVTLPEFLARDVWRVSPDGTEHPHTSVIWASALLVDCLRLKASKGKMCERLNVKGAKAAWMAGDLPLLLTERRRSAMDRDACAEALQHVVVSECLAGGT